MYSMCEWVRVLSWKVLGGSLLCSRVKSWVIKTKGEALLTALWGGHAGEPQTAITAATARLVSPPALPQRPLHQSTFTSMFVSRKSQLPRLLSWLFHKRKGYWSMWRKIDTYMMIWHDMIAYSMTIWYYIWYMILYDNMIWYYDMTGHDAIWYIS